VIEDARKKGGSFFAHFVMDFVTTRKKPGVR